MARIVRKRKRKQRFFPSRLRAHFGVDPATLTVVGERFAVSEQPNLHLALEGYVSEAGRTYELLGMHAESAGFSGITLSQLISGGSGYFTISRGPVEYTTVEVDCGRTLACTQVGLFLVAEGEERLAILVQGRREHYDRAIKIEVLARDRAKADACLQTVRTAMRKRNVYRGHVVSLSVNEAGLHVAFHHLPRITREQIILPAGVLERVERESIAFSTHAERLLAAGRHLKRGMLLHGAPGTGKTLTAMYLAGRMRDRTVILITGRSMGLLEQACAMARVLQPATVILEDIDLIAEERTRQAGGCAPLLFELLNQMDGLADDADILFVLTTNRPDLLEPALAARPGRIDQAVEVPLPDAECRRRLLELYGRGLHLTAPLDRYAERTAGASGAFIRELLRKAALFAADHGDDLTIGERHLDEALHEMVVEGGELTRSLLGAARGSA